MSIVLELPYPPSANLYWRTRVIRSRKGAFVSTYISADAKKFKATVCTRCRQAGVRKPMIGRIQIDYWLYPGRPQDWVRRTKNSPDYWDTDVRCLDLDNVPKILLDSLKNVAFEDDKFVFALSGERMEPDARGARLVVEISPYRRDKTSDIFEEPSND